MSDWLRFQITFQTIKDTFKIAVILALLFAGISVMYSAAFPAFKGMLEDMVAGFGETFNFIPGATDMGSYVGFLNIELYQIFFILILALIIGFIAATQISKEIEAKTIDIFLSNPISRKQIVLEKYLGMIPLILIINFATLAAVAGITVAIGEEVNFGDLVMTHIVAIPYFLAIASMGFLVSVIIDEKMKASIILMGIVVGMFVFRSLSLMIPDYEKLGLISITHYYNPYEILIKETVDPNGVAVLIGVCIVCLIIAMFYFEKRDIAVA